MAVDLGFVIAPFLLVGAGLGQGLANDILHTHAAGGIAQSGGSSEAVSGRPRALDVFAQGKLDAGRGTFEDQPLGVFAPAHLHHLALAADGVGAAVQYVGGSHTAGQSAVDIDIVRVDNILNPHHRRDGHRAFIDAVGRDVRVAVDDAGHHELAARVDDARAIRDQHLFAGFYDLAIANQDGALEGSFGDGEHGGVANDGGLGSRRQCCGKQGQQEKDEAVHWTPPGVARPSLSPLSPDGGASGTGSYFTPSTKMYWILAFSSNKLPFTTSRLAILPGSMEPTRSATP